MHKEEHKKKYGSTWNSLGNASSILFQRLKLLTTNVTMTPSTAPHHSWWGRCCSLVKICCRKVRKQPSSSNRRVISKTGLHCRLLGSLFNISCCSLHKLYHYSCVEGNEGRAARNIDYVVPSAFPPDIHCLREHVQMSLPARKRIRRSSSA